MRSARSQMPNTAHTAVERAPWRALWAAFAVTAILVAACASAAEPPAIVDNPGSCSTKGCHTSIESLEFTHAPSQAGACDMCHEQVGRKHEFQEMLPIAQLCTACHEPVTDRTLVHEPALSDCDMCHDPHGGATPTLLRLADQKSICFQCHDEEIMDAGFQHGPASIGACTVCHDPHSSEEPRLLREPVRNLCASCHSESVDEMDSAVYLHAPVSEGCTTCHNPHSGETERMLPATTEMLCGQCHEEITTLASQAQVLHDPAVSAQGCLLCHAPHGAERAALLKAAQADLCLSCHNEGLASGENHLTDMKSLLDDNPNWHGPVRTGNCTGCHQPHGSENFRLLKMEYPKKFYSPFDMANYELCFSCHDPALVKTEETTTLTNFRDGKQNLHFLHVNKDRRGRTCRACHEVHASTLPSHIRESVPYGKWDLPIHFTKIETGGSCMPGCHEEKRYDRGLVQ